MHLQSSLAPHCLVAPEETTSELSFLLDLWNTSLSASIESFQVRATDQMRRNYQTKTIDLMVKNGLQSNLEHKRAGTFDQYVCLLSCINQVGGSDIVCWAQSVAYSGEDGSVFN